jgi:hypothetical protein
MLLTQLLCVSLAAADPCQAILAKLQAGVTWTTAEGALVFSWSPADFLSQVRVSGCMPGLDMDLVVTHKAQCEHVIQTVREREWPFGNVFDRVIHFTMQFPQMSLPELHSPAGQGGPCFQPPLCLR